MQINTDIIHDHHNLDSLIAAASLHPTETIRDKLIEAEIDGFGRHIGFGAAMHYWYSVLPDNGSKAV